MATTACDSHDWTKVMTFKRKLKIEDLHISHETTAYQRKERHISLKIDVIGADSPIKGLNMESTSKKESEKKSITKIDVGKIEGDELIIDVMFCTKCEKQLPPPGREIAWMQLNERDLVSELKQLYLTE